MSDVGPGDYVKVRGQLLTIDRIIHRDVSPGRRYGKFWTVYTTDGQAVSMYDIDRYYRRGDISPSGPRTPNTRSDGANG